MLGMLYAYFTHCSLLLKPAQNYYHFALHAIHLPDSASCRILECMVTRMNIRIPARAGTAIEQELMPQVY